MIDPKIIMNTLSIDKLNESAEKYFQGIPQPHLQMGKPFTSIQEAPELLYNFGMLLSGLNLGKSMKVLDFGAGTCWISRFLNQMQCITVSSDVSETALELGKQLFKLQPVLGGFVEEPQFIVFDGYTIDLPDESVDRIIVNDAFHHIPNPDKIMSEFYRVLRPGGIIGLSEPGRFHSQKSQSQYEMKNYGVLENDIILEDIQELCDQAGFERIEVKLLTNPYQNITLEDYKALIEQGIPERFLPGIREAALDKTIFFIHKSGFSFDSRSHLGLKHEIHCPVSEITISRGELSNIPVRLMNTGISKWLHQNVKDIGVVKLAGHLYTGEKEIVNFDFCRYYLPYSVEPGQDLEITANVKITEPGSYILSLDLVAEDICWFENIGSIPHDIHIKVY